MEEIKIPIYKKFERYNFNDDKYTIHVMEDEIHIWDNINKSHVTVDINGKFDEINRIFKTVCNIYDLNLTLSRRYVDTLDLSHEDNWNIWRSLGRYTKIDTVYVDVKKYIFNDVVNSLHYNDVDNIINKNKDTR